MANKPSFFGDKAKDLASFGVNYAKTFGPTVEGTPPEKTLGYGPGPEPKSLTKKPPADYYTSYGAYAPRGMARKRNGRKRRGK